MKINLFNKFKISILLLCLIILGILFITKFNISITKNRPTKNNIPEKASILENKTDEFISKNSPNISINNENDLLQKRKELIEFIWKSKGFPSDYPKVESNIFDSEFSSENLKKIDKLTVSMNYGLNSIMYHFFPIKNDTNKLIIYAEGHGGDFLLGKNTINFFLENGYSVIAINMPLVGKNNKPIVNIDRIGELKLENHYYFQFLESENFTPIQFFMDPVALAVNYANSLKYEEVFMIGISGGGWTTTLYSAIDQRIKKSYPVAGTLPLHLRSPKDLGDYEQSLPRLYTIANYEELYIMGSYGKNRKQIQILNKYDPCCFAGEKHIYYVNKIKNKVITLGLGKFEFFLDDSHQEHIISRKMLDKILKDMGK